MNKNKYTAPQAGRELRRRLRQLSYSDPAIPPVTLFSSAEDTENAVRAFQAEYELPVTGYADEATWNSLHDAYTASILAASPPQAFCPFPSSPADFCVSPGDSGFIVLAIHYLLERASLVFDLTLPGCTNLVYDTKTEKAVKEIQRIAGFPVTGKTDRRTWDFLVIVDRSSEFYS